jgi:putative methionine-R-sulfoxide reductase with GAF domain
MRSSMNATGQRATDTLAIVRTAGAEAASAVDAEAAIRAIARVCFGAVGNRAAHESPGALPPGRSQFFVAGAFFVTPGRQYQMLVGNIGFPPEQDRLTIPINSGHPGRVVAAAQPLLLRDTREHPEFVQFLSTSRMGSAIYAPLIWKGDILGQIFVAAQAFGTLDDEDLALLTACAGLASSSWIAHAGPAWLSGTWADLSAPLA